MFGAGKVAPLVGDNLDDLDDENPISGSSRGNQGHDREGKELEDDYAAQSYEHGAHTYRMKMQQWSENIVLTSAYWLHFVSDRDFKRAFWIKKFLQIQNELQLSQHYNPHSLFFPVVTNDIPMLQRRIDREIEKDPTFNLCNVRDVSGATIIHTAYLYKRYQLAHYLVRKYPQVGLESYSGEKSELLLNKLKIENIPNPESYTMPYTGENILHICIVRRNYAEVRWLLDIYRDHKVNKPTDKMTRADGCTNTGDKDESPLGILLNSPATGSMFEREGVFYFGGYPLHFAACSNDKQIFDLVLSFSAHTTKDSLALDTQSIFLRDLYGNSILHLCVINCLEDMYKHVYETALNLLTNQIIDLWTRRNQEQRIYKLPGFQERAEGDNIHGYAMKERLLELPIFEDANIDDLAKVDRWAMEQARVKVNERLSLSLNDDLHSPITLAGAQMHADDSEKATAKKQSMLRFMIGHLKAPLWTFGPVTKVIVDLDGLERRHLLHRYAIPSSHIPKVKAQQYDHENCHGSSTIEALCFQDADQGFAIEEIEKIITVKWDRVGFAPFLTSFFYHFTLTILTTVILTYINMTPTFSPAKKYPGQMIVNFLYPICVIMYVGFFIMECVDLYKLRWYYLTYKMFGIARFDFKCRMLKMISFLCFCIGKTVISYTNRGNKYEANDDNLHFNPQNHPLTKVCIALCVMFSWIHLYYFLMGFDSTGPIILTIFRVATNDVRQFLRFFCVSLMAFACAISVFANSGNPEAGYGFKHLLNTMWNLIQMTVQGPTTNFFPANEGDDDDGSMVSLSFVPQDLKWMQDILRTSYLAVANILMINLLIGMITNTYEMYSNFSASILLMEKYNIMAMYERTLSRDELTELKDKYSRVQETTEWFDEKNLIDSDHAKAARSLLSNEVDTKSDQVPKKLVKRGRSSIGISSQFSREIANMQADDMAAEARLSSGFSNKFFKKYRVLHFKFELEDIDDDKWELDEADKDSSQGLTNTTLFIIDPQVDFHPGGGEQEKPSYHHEGSLAVPGANEDSSRIADMIRKNMSKITEIIVSMDSHYPAHIAHAIFWTDWSGKKHPEPFTTITHQDVVKGRWKPRDAALLQWCKMYTFKLEQKGRMVLTIWPPHCIIGSRGHAVVPVINEALQEWSHTTGHSVHYVLKGQNLRCEMYSALEAEVVDPTDNSTALNVALLAKLRATTRVSLIRTHANTMIFFIRKFGSLSCCVEELLRTFVFVPLLSPPDCLNS